MNRFLRSGAAPSRRGDWQRAGLAGIGVLLLAAVFVVDTVTDYGLAFPVLYCALILAALHVFGSRVVLPLSGCCVLLTIVSLYLTRAGAYEIGLVNAGLSILAIAATAWLARQYAAAQQLVAQTQDRLARLSRASSMGEVATSIAHELNQPLAAVCASAQACQRWLAQTPPNQEKAVAAAARVVAEAERASAVVERVRALTRGEAPLRTRFDLNRLVRDALQSLPESARDSLRVNLVLTAELPAACADPLQIQQVLANVLFNAWDAMREVPPARQVLRIRTQVHADGRLYCEVEDRGPGCRPQDLPSLFEPFWSTKPDGMGMGLAICRSIVEANGGQIEARARSGGGLIVGFSVPRADGEKP